MARLKYNFAEAETSARFPAHGWATNTQEVKILWCPLQKRIEQALFRKSGSEPSLRGTYQNAMPFAETLRKLAVTLREMHHAIRVSCEHSCTSKDEEAFAVHWRTTQMVPLFVDLAFIYLRRLPDLLVVACRPLLFERWQSVPQAYKQWVKDPSQLRRYGPKCDIDALVDTILEHSDWFNELRDVSPTTGKKGIRDALEHRGVRLIVGKQQSGENKPLITVTTDSKASDVEVRKDILPQIPTAIAGMCQLMTGVSVVAGFDGPYEQMDALGCIEGTDDDLVGYWPELSEIGSLHA